MYLAEAQSAQRKIITLVVVLNEANLYLLITINAVYDLLVENGSPCALCASARKIAFILSLLFVGQPVEQAHG